MHDDMNDQTVQTTHEILNSHYRQVVAAKNAVLHGNGKPTPEETLVWLVSLSEIWVVDSLESSAEVLYE